MTDYFILKIHYSLTLYMMGIIWLVQIIHYPLFKLVGDKNFNDYHKGHIQKTSLVIAIPMILEALTGLYLLISNDFYRNNFNFLVAFALLLFNWFATFFISVPKHNILARGFDLHAVNTLTKTNWLRTIAWSTRAIFIFLILN